LGDVSTLKNYRKKFNIFVMDLEQIFRTRDNTSENWDDEYYETIMTRHMEIELNVNNPLIKKFIRNE